MSRLTKISLLIFGIVIVIAITMAVLVKTLVTPEKIRAAVVPLTEKTLHRKVALKNIHISLFSGISLQDLEVRQKVGTDNFITVKSLEMHYQLLPLLVGKVVIDHIKLVQPQFVVVRQPDGAFNLDDLLSRAVEDGGIQAENQQPLTPLASTPKKSSSGTALNLLVRSVSVSGGHLLFIDRSQPRQEPIRFSLNKLFIKANDITLDKPFPIELSATLNSAKISLAGTYDLDGSTGNINIDLQPLNLVDFAPYFSKFMPGKLGSGRIFLNVNTKLSPDLISVKGKINLDKVDLLLTKLPKADLKQARLEIDASLSYQLKTKLLHLSNSIIKFNNIPVRTEGNINLSGKEPNLAMAIFLDHLDLDRLNQGLPQGMAKDIQPYKLAGQVNALVELAGKPSVGVNLLQKADLRFENIQADLSGIKTGINGGVEFAGQELKADNLMLNLADQPTKFSMDVRNIFGDHISGYFQLTADNLDFNKLIPTGKEKKVKAEADTTLQSSTEIQTSPSGQGEADTPPAVEQQKNTVQQDIGPFSIPAEINGKVTINQGIYKQLTLDNISADVQLKNNHIQIVQASCDVAGGNLNASADLDLGVKGLAYQGKLTLSNLQMAVLNSGLFGDSVQSLTGVMNSDNTFAGHGTQSPVLLKSLQANGQTTIKDGQISGSPMLITLANFLGNINLEKLDFASLQGRYTMQKGLVALNGGLDSSLLKLTPEGTISVDGPMDISLDARLSPAAMVRLGSDNQFKQAMTDENGWGILPLKLKGTLKSPEIALDSKALQKQVIGKAEQALQKKLLKKLSKNKKGQKDDKNKQLLDSTLKKLFGN